MRVTIDIDSHNVLSLSWTLLKGIVICRRIPFYFRKTHKGFHIAWRGLNISQDTMFKYRHIIGDDENRIKLDRERKKTIRQVMFTEKSVYKFDGTNKIRIQ